MVGEKSGVAGTISPESVSSAIKAAIFAGVRPAYKAGKFFFCPKLRNPRAVNQSEESGDQLNDSPYTPSHPILRLEHSEHGGYVLLAPGRPFVFMKHDAESPDDLHWLQTITAGPTTPPVSRVIGAGEPKGATGVTGVV